jgi:methyltransferase (TIGR00027 family)
MPRLASGQPSVTAWKVALRRAAHQIADKPPVFADPLAIAILGPAWDRAKGSSGLICSAAFARGLRAFMAARARYAEDQLAEAYARGVRQYLVLGAGLDTFAYRSPWPALRVFEVDHPATQAWKRHRLAEAGIAVPASLTFAPVDFEREGLAEGLARAGFDASAVTFVSWLGVVFYLTEAAVFDTLGLIARLPKGSEVVFDFGVARDKLGLVSRLALDALSARVALAGEPFRSLFDPEALAARLKTMGFSEAEVSGSAELNARYFNGRADGLKLSGAAGRLMRARV